MIRCRPSTSPFALTALLLTAPAPAQVVAYHGKAGAEHQQQWNTLAPQGYRMIALSIYGTTGSPRYAAVWVHRAGPAFIGFHGSTAAQYQQFADANWPLGYRPRLLTATGSGGDPRFAGVWELTNAPGWTSHGLTEQQFWDERQTARDNGLDVVTVDVYGSANDPRYIAAFGPLDAGQGAVVSGSASGFQTHFDALGAGHARPVLVAFNDSHRYVSLWQSNEVGAWVAHHDMTPTEYQDHTDAYAQQNRYPISVQGSGSGSSTRFAAVWAPTDLPPTPPFTATGPAVPQLAPFDVWVRNWMAQNQTRAASLAVVRHGQLVYARGYTRALPGHPITQPDSLFEIASCSKPLTSICMHQHFEDPQAQMTAGDAMLGYFPTLAPLDAQLAQITLDSLLTHQGGWDRAVSPDPMIGQDPTIAAVYNLSLPIGKGAILRYMVETQTLDFAPDTASEYSNFGYSVLGQVLEVRNPGLSYEQILHQRLFGPLGVTRPRISNSLQSGLHPGEVGYHPYTPWLSRSVMSDAQPWVAGQYGAWNKGNMDAHGAWVLAAPDYAKVLAAFDLGAGNPILGADETADMWTVEPGYSTLVRGWYLADVPDGSGGTARMFHHNGRLSGAVSFVARREDGLSFVFLTNGDRSNLFGDVHGAQLNEIANRITSWPTTDLFPRFGIPAFQFVPGSAVPFGSAGTGSAGTPHLSLPGTPAIGEALDFLVRGVPPSQLVFLVLGLGRQDLPLDRFGAPGCTLYTNPLATFAAFADGNGLATLRWNAPATPAAIGLRVVVQGAALDPPANLLGIVTTQGLQVQLGGWQ